MLGHRRVRLGISFPEIYQMQIRAILEAAAECQKAAIEVHPKIKVPQVCTVQELKIVKQWVDGIHEEIKVRDGKPASFQFGKRLSCWISAIPSFSTCSAARGSVQSMRLNTTWTRS
jgi:phosphoenolpyruvate synthase/pyruvate phosphate dikinase